MHTLFSYSIVIAGEEKRFRVQTHMYENARVRPYVGFFSVRYHIPRISFYELSASALTRKRLQSRGSSRVRCSLKRAEAKVIASSSSSCIKFGSGGGNCDFVVVWVGKDGKRAIAQGSTRLCHSGPSDIEIIPECLPTVLFGMLWIKMRLWNPNLCHKLST